MRYIRREAALVGEAPDPAAVGQVVDGRVSGVAGDRPGVRGADGEGMHGLEVGLVEVRERAPRVVGLEGRPDVDELVAGVDRPLDAVTAGRVGLSRAHD